jgi:hypothetical protein
MADGPRRSLGPLVLALGAVGLVLGLGGCQVHASILENDIGQVSFEKDCGPARTQVIATNLAAVPYDITISTDGTDQSERLAVGPGSGLGWSGPVDATQAQVTFVRTGGGGGDHGFTTPLPRCGG